MTRSPFVSSICFNHSRKSGLPSRCRVHIAPVLTHQPKAAAHPGLRPGCIRWNQGQFWPGFVVIDGPRDVMPEELSSMGHGDNLAGVDHAGPIRLRGLGQQHRTGGSGQALCQAILTDTVLHGPVTLVFSLKRQSRTEAAMPEPPVTLAVM